MAGSDKEKHGKELITDAHFTFCGVHRAQSLKRPLINISARRDTTARSCLCEARRYILTLIHLQTADGFYFNIPNNSQHCDCHETYDKQAPPHVTFHASTESHIQQKGHGHTHSNSPSISSDNRICLWSRLTAEPRVLTLAQHDLQPRCVWWRWWNAAIVLDRSGCRTDQTQRCFLQHRARARRLQSHSSWHARGHLWSF